MAEIPFEPYTGQSKLRFWCQKVLPLVYDDSLSYYELLNKVVDYLNNTITDVSACEDNITALRDAFVQLQDYVNEHLDDIEQTVETVIDEMIDSGEFGEFVAGVVNGLIAGEYSTTQGYAQFDYVLKDGKLYCATASTSGEWDATKWRETTVGEDMQLLNQRIYNLNAGQVEYNGMATYDNNTVGKKFQELELYSSDIRKGGTLTNADDLNNITEHGMYYWNVASVPKNVPWNTTSLLKVFGGTSTTSSLVQEAYIYNQGNQKKAIRYLSSNSWSPWFIDDGTANDTLNNYGAENVRFPLNNTWSSANTDPYTYHKKVVTLLHFSDVHGYESEFNQLMAWANTHRNLFDDMLCTGDLVEWYNESTGIDYLEFWKKQQYAQNILITIGNHDAKKQASSSTAGWIRKTQARLRELYMYGISNWGVTSPTGKAYWYKDYDNSDVRLIGLDTTVESGSTADTEQQTWLTDILNSARTANKHVVIAEHYQPSSPIGVRSDFTAENRSIWSNTVMSMPSAYPTLVQSFIDAGGTFIGWLCGHTHTDFIAYNSDYPKQKYFVVTSLWNDLRTSDQARTQYTQSFIAANLVGIDTEHGIIKLSRIGANSDFNLRPRQNLVYDYIKGLIVSETSGDIIEIRDLGVYDNRAEFLKATSYISGMLIRKGNIISISIEAHLLKNLTSSQNTWFTIPNGYRPSNPIIGVGLLNSASERFPISVSCGSNGNINFYANKALNADDNYRVVLNLTYPLNTPVANLGS